MSDGSEFSSLTPIDGPADARRVVEAGLHGLPPETIQTAELLTSELVTNAIVYGSDHAKLVLVVDARHVHVEVHDADASTHHLEPLHVDESSSHGRGLAIVDALASTWGVERHDYGKAVWFNLNF